MAVAHANVRRGEVARGELLRAALEEFAESGYVGASLQRVGARVELTRTGVLHHFGSKDALLLAVLQHYFPAGGRFGALEDGANVTVFEAFGATLQQHAHDPVVARFYSVFAAESASRNHPAHAFFQARVGRINEAVARGFSRIFPNLSPSEAQLKASLIIAAVDGFTLQQALHPEIDVTPAFTELVQLLSADSSELQHGTVAPR